MEQYVTTSTTSDGITVLTLDNKEARVNILSTPFMDDLESALDKLATSQKTTALIIQSGKSAGFVAGANIDEIRKIHTESDGYEKSRKGQRVFQKIADLPFPTIGVVNGHCMGGGTEMILACDFRLAAREDARIALPEVKLGLFPGWGGTQRLPRLISIQRALDMILTGKTYSADRALKIGLVDRSVPDRILNDYSLEFVRKIRETGRKKQLTARKKKSGGIGNFLLEKTRPGRSIIWRQARKRVLQNTGGHYPAPLKALDVIADGLSTNLEKGLEIEARGFAEVIVTPEHKNLLHVYNLSHRPKKMTGVETDTEPDHIENTGVLGAGVMGGGIAQLLAYNNFPVRMKDIEEQMVVEGLKHANTVFEKAVTRHKISQKMKSRLMENISGTIRYDGFSRVDVVIEAVVENIQVKQQVLREVENHLSDSAVFASNTSALSINKLQKVSKIPERICGMHFFNPVHKMPLVEVVRGEKTSDKTIATIFNLAKQLNKTPIIVKDSPGFLVNRLLGVYLNEACLLADEGNDFVWIDEQVENFGMPMGPFRLIDEVGIGIAAEVARTLAGAFDEYLDESTLLRKVSDAGLSGKKGGSGFYTYKDGKKESENSQVRKYADGKIKQDKETIINRMTLLMINEAARSLEAGIVKSPKDIDTGMIFGTGFPPFRGGLCSYADTVGFDNILTSLKPLESLCGPRFHPANYLQTEPGFYKK